MCLIRRLFGSKESSIHLVMVMKSGDVLRPDDELEFFEKYDDVKAMWDVIELGSPVAIYGH
jgi:hypothetical protein